MADIGSLGKLAISLEANIAKFESDLGKAEHLLQKSMARMDGFASGLTSTLKTTGLALAGLGAGLSLAAIESKFESVTSGLANLKEMSEKTSASVENLSALSAVAKVTGDDMGEVEKGIIKMSKALAGADDASKGAGHALEFLGLKAADLRKMDPAEAFQLLAEKMDGVAASSGKTALALDIFGKSGAQLLPYMHDLATSGDLAAKVTDKQAVAAKAYEEDVRRLTLVKDQLYKTVTIATLPAMDSFVKVLIKAATDADGLRQAGKRLADDGTIGKWAEAAAMAAAHVLDEFQLIKALAIEIATPIERIGRNIYTVGALASIAVTGSLDEKRKAYAALKTENEAYFADLDARLANNRQPIVLYADRMRAQLAADRAARASASGEDVKKNASGYTSRAPTDGKNATASAYGSYLDQLDQMIAKMSQGEYAALRLKAAQLATKEKTSPDAAYGKIDAYQKAVEAVKIDAFAEGLQKTNRQYAEQATLVGLSTKEQEKYAIARKNSEAAEALILAAEKAHVGFSLDAQEKIRQAAEESTKSILASLESRRTAEARWQNGARAGLKNYLDDVANVAKSTEALVTRAFGGMEDALVNFVKTGKLDFKSLADSIISDLIRIQIRQSITAPLAKAIDGFNVGDFFSGLFGGGKASGGSVDSSKYYLVGENGPELFAPGRSGSIIPNESAFGGGGMVVNIIESPGNGGQQQQRSAGGVNILDVFVEQVKSSIASDISRGSGAVPAAMSGTYGLNRAVGAY